MNKIDILKWKLHKTKETTLIIKAARKGYIKLYDDELINNLRNIYYGGLPASILLLHRGICNGKCYDRAPLLAYALNDDYEVVYANINNIKLNPLYVDEYKKDSTYAEHCYIISKDSNGIEWVYDPSSGFIIEKNTYYKIEKPVERMRNNKETTINFMNHELENQDIKNDKYMSALMIPMLEYCFEPINIMYEKKLREEIELFKQLIDYDKLDRHINPKGMFEETKSKVLKK